MYSKHLASIFSAGVLLLVSITPLHAQWAPPPVFPRDRLQLVQAQEPKFVIQVAADEQVNTATLATMGVMGAGLGLAAGGLLGAFLGRDLGCCNYDGSVGSFVGAAAGMAILTPTAVHLTNHRKGELATEILVASGISALGFAAFLGTLDWDSPGPLGAIIATVALQTFSAVKIERATSNSGR